MNCATHFAVKRVLEAYPSRTWTSTSIPADGR